MSLAVLLSVVSGCARQKEYSSQQFLMDTVVEITVFGATEEKAREGAAAAFDEIKRIADLTDRFAHPGSKAFSRSDVCRVNSMAGISPVMVSRDVLTMVELSQEYNKITGGAFDITVGPLMDLWSFSRQPSVPPEKLLRERLSLVGMDKVVIDKNGKSVFLTRKGMSLDLGAVAKGYAAEKAAGILKEKGITQGIINAGGNVVVLGKKGNETPWKLGIQNPRDGDSLIGVLDIHDQAVVTSGDYQRYFEKSGVRYHHLLDPSTGKPARDLISVTVVCDSSARADILSTALFVMGKEKGMELLSRLHGVEALFVSRDKEITVTPGLEDKIQVTPGKDFSYDPNG